MARNRKLTWSQFRRNTLKAHLLCVKKTVLSATLALALGGRALASSGTEGASFLDIPVGAGPAAMGSAYTALATNAYAPTWNPGALGFVPGLEFSGQHLSYLESINYEYISAVFPLPRSRESGVQRTLGFSAQYLGSGDITRTNDSGNIEGEFSSHYGAYNFAYGQTLGEKLSLGVTGKMIQAKIDDVSASAYATDFGALYKAGEKLALGATLVNVGSKLKFISEGDPLPLAFRVGAAYKPLHQILTSAEVVYRKTGLASFHTGIQWRPLDAISMRLGYRTDTLKGLSALAGLSTGIGIHAWGQELSYAWVPYGDLGNTQYFSLHVKLGDREEAKRNLIQYKNIRKHQNVKGGNKPQERDINEQEFQQLMQLMSDDEAAVVRNR
jgi:hypothetical protein